MNKIVKFLNDNNIKFESNENKSITITIDKNLEFTNKYGDKIIYNNYITIINKYSYHPFEIKKFQDRKIEFKYQDGKQINIIEKLKMLLNL